MKIKHLLMTLLLALMVPLAAKAQTTIYEMDFASSPYGWDTYNTLGTGTVTVSNGKLVFTANTLGTLSGNSGCIFGDKMCDLTNETGERVVKVGLTLRPSEATNATNQFLFAVGYFANGSSTFTSKQAFSSKDSDFKDLHGNLQEASFTVVMEMPAGARIAFQMVSTFVNKSWLLDDVFVQDVVPSNLTASNLTHESVDLSWDAHGASRWEIRYKKTSATEWSNVLGVTINSYTLEGLESNKTYCVQVRAKAATGNYYSSWSQQLSFTTPYRQFSADNGYGQTLYYNVIDEENHYVALTFPNSANPTAPWEGYIQPTGNLVLPSTVTNESVTYTVTQVGERAFRGCSGVTGVTIPSTVTVIDNYAFYGNNMTGQLIIPNSVITIGAQAFDDAYNNPGNVELTIGEGVTSIGYAAFDMYALSSVHFNAINCTTMGTNVFGAYFTQLTIGSQVTNIPGEAFKNRSYINNVLIIPASVQNIGTNAFKGCTKLPSVYFEGGSNPANIGDAAFNGCTSLASATLNVGAIGISAFGDCSSLSSLSLGTNVSTIGNSAFLNCTSLGGGLVIPNSVTTIGQTAFWGTSITAVTIGEGVTSVGAQAFWKCPNLTTVHFNAINCTSMNSIYNEEYYSVFNAAENDPVSNTHAILATVTIGPNVTNIPEYAFKVQNFTSPINIPSSVQHIGEQAFLANWGVTSFSIAAGSQLVSIGDRAFYNCKYMTGDLNLPEGFTEIGMEAFDMCKLSSVNIPSTLHAISTAAFSGCKFSSVNIPSTVTSIGTYAFSGCGAEQGMVVNIEGDFEYGTYIRNYAFKDSKTKALTLGEGRFYIMEQAFKGCNMLEGDLVIPRATIGNSAFMDCTSLSSVHISENVITTEISEDAFNNCSGLTGNLIIPNKIATIGARAFNGCTSLNGVLVLGQGVTSIGEAAFKQCGFSDIIVEPATRPTTASDAFESVPSSLRLYVPYGQASDYQTATGWNEISNRYEQYEYIANNGNWVRTDSWANGATPLVSNVVCINADNALMNQEGARVKFLYVRSGKTLNVTAKLTATLGVHTPSASSLVIKENSAQHGQLVNPSNYTLGTVQKSITGYGTESNKSGWYTVAAPVQESLSVDGLAVGEYDLYYYDEPSRNWKNQKVASNNFTTINPAMGYLYAKQTTGNVEFAGLLNPQDASFTVPVTSTTSSDNLAGFNLVGNPYTYNININNVKINGTALTQYYKVEGGSGLMAYATEGPIRTGEGFLVKATANGDLTFNMSSRGVEDNDSYLRLVLSQDGRMADRAYLRLNEGDVLEKMVIDDAQSLLYFEEDDERYAIAPNSNEKSVPLYFEPSANGHFTIDASLLNAECDYLHLIDNLTGNDIDLLETSTYAFDARYTDYTSRFKLVFAKDCYENNDNFAFFSDGEIILSGVNGNSTVQVFDVNGRCISSTNGANRIAVNNMASGVYMLRLINGENVKTQKIVVK